jgi:hypothetical protein
MQKLRNLIFAAVRLREIRRDVTFSASSRPATLIETDQSAAKDFEHDFQIVRAAGTIHNSKCTRTQCGGHFAIIVPSSQAPLNNHRWRRRIEPGEEFQEADARIIRHGRVAAAIERNSEVNHCKMDGNALDKSRCLHAATSRVRSNTHGF